ncbi:MAG: PstS family phosphate ABC transporter substrate-binding protein [Candidatus Omnitrophica bacterium]|nr:PstS family phosphate ABC transporter substrate-binding protein [Candidatus Omnitrophota bacterium]
MKRIFFAFFLTMSLVACSKSALAADPVKVDGSSTVFPITEAVAEEFGKSGGGKVIVGISGTGGGFKRFCRGETDISDASRPIKQKEIDACREGGVEYIELPVAYDGLAVVINPQNSWVDYLTVAELKKIWEPDAQGVITKWSQVRSGFPAQEIQLFGPGTDSGTFDYFTEVINGKAASSRGDYTASEDDNVLVEGVASSKGGLGYFGLAYYEENSGRVKIVPVKGKGAAVVPSRDTVLNGTYTPLSRPLFIYVNKDSLKTKPLVAKFVRYYLENAPTLSEEVGYVALPQSEYEAGLNKI